MALPSASPGVTGGPGSTDLSEGDATHGAGGVSECDSTVGRAIPWAPVHRSDGVGSPANAGPSRTGAAPGDPRGVKADETSGSTSTSAGSDGIDFAIAWGSGELPSAWGRPNIGINPKPVASAGGDAPGARTNAGEGVVGWDTSGAAARACGDVPRAGEGSAGAMCLSLDGRGPSLECTGPRSAPPDDLGVGSNAGDPKDSERRRR